MAERKLAELDLEQLRKVAAEHELDFYALAAAHRYGIQYLDDVTPIQRADTKRDLFGYLYATRVCEMEPDEAERVAIQLRKRYAARSAN